MLGAAPAPVGEAKDCAAQIRHALAGGGSKDVAKSSKRFFREQVTCYGWKTAPLRRFAHQWRRRLLAEKNLGFVVEVADQLFRRGPNEDKNFAVFLLEQSPAKLSEAEFHLFESWLDRVENWSDHDGLTMYLLGPMMLADRSRAGKVFEWAKSNTPWGRRAAAVSLIRGIRRGFFWQETQRIARILLRDHELMVQKGVGWMLREAVKANGPQVVSFLFSIRNEAPRLVLRTACETLSGKIKRKVLGSRGEAGT